MFAAASIERETDPSRFQVIAMSLKAPFERLGDKLSQPHSTQPASAITRLKSASGKINRRTYKSIFAWAAWNDGG